MRRKDLKSGIRHSASGYDFVVAGSGFSGSLMAMVLKRLGFSVIILERGKHPRFAIGESSTPLTNLMWEQLAAKYKLDSILPLSKWGTWQATYPEIGCGLKRGFTFYHHTPGNAFQYDPCHENELLVAASPNDQIADTHWYRQDFDYFLLREAQKLEVDYVDEVLIDTVTFDEKITQLTGHRKDENFSVTARFIIDATGPRGLLFRLLKLPEKRWQNLPPTEALYTHFTDVERISNMGVYPNDAALPYSADDAAMHHVFDGGWVWILPFNNGITSAGVAARSSFADDLKFSEGEPAWHRLLELFPTIKQQFARAKKVFPFIHHRQLSFCSEVAVGKNWAMLPSAAGFIDPLLSTGFPLTISGILRLSKIIEQDWDSDRFTDSLKQYESETVNELSVCENLVAALYRNMNDFQLFSRITLLYFAAASFMETTHRLNKPELASSFLLNRHLEFGAVLRRICEQACKTTDKTQLIAEIEEAIRPFDVIGLAKFSRRNWYPCLATDLFEAADKLQATKQNIEELLKRTNFQLQ
jgi:tetracycline 7-halogenase / FADH2 O2-dependent halogenase